MSVIARFGLHSLRLEFQYSAMRVPKIQFLLYVQFSYIITVMKFQVLQLYLVTIMSRNDELSSTMS